MPSTPKSGFLLLPLLLFGSIYGTWEMFEQPTCCRCKLFYKKDAEFKEKGVGTLHLKLTQHGKTQLIIRADTNLGE